MAKLKPAYEVEIGNINARCYLNKDKYRGTWYSIAVVRLVREASGAVKSRETTFYRDDLPAVRAVIDQCWVWLWREGNNGPVFTNAPTPISDRSGPKRNPDAKS